MRLCREYICVLRKVQDQILCRLLPCIVRAGRCG
ncbi:RepA leader peptide Tap [Lelliottia nimipressuralis]|uniref:RepA leader peptide Tap n=1 Tax=Lelliottia nimipressuralis TaxID=69220 RepID=A0ABY3NY27_9ENTR|nr:RepA leader peptide Tap [Lelliottia nimipressuralis]TYT29283.1 RepA leader peptide Tap [Lelliottia nimipressuralis]